VSNVNLYSAESEIIRIYLCVCVYTCNYTGTLPDVTPGRVHYDVWSHTATKHLVLRGTRSACDREQILMFVTASEATAAGKLAALWCT